ncbi:uncharacterized protein LOC111255646 [Zea mays]|jgi:hypothetical protein|uniref:Uncharacterized protein n=1 Tax=Zea mays TaxID=4577 RepID=B6SMF3_MAIZE|nr:uncharacterized protein LOC111255646 [Zea mays]ACG26036.1 hypothetical protein [Zea mays]AQK89146.1 hypothetical protein ZEAMMB73_Zm00001d008181 [Zea mays]|eukprot:NP_001343909.1 uncharacterized protein LOC111255646 [Zea mays]
MVGALAWQATVIKEDIFVSWGWRSHGGLFFGPGFSSLVVFRVPMCIGLCVVCDLSSPTRFGFLHLTRRSTTKTNMELQRDS